MKIFGRELTFFKKDAGLAPQVVGDRGGWWWPVIRESFTGAWQQGVVIRPETALSNHAVFSCVTRIASDISKLRIKLVEQGADGIWREVSSPAFSPVLTKPNAYQNRIKFIEQWILSKLLYGNTYVLKSRDNRGVVTELHILHPAKVQPLVTPDGGVYYRVGIDLLAGLETGVDAIPATEMIHDTMNALYHPLMGLSPIYAAGLAATQGLRIQHNSSNFFANGSRPGGVLTAPGVINKETAERLKQHWETNFTGENIGRVAVLGDGLTYQPMVMSAVDAQLLDQLKWTAEMVCSCFQVPSYMVGVTPAPARANMDALTQQYYNQCLQILVESMELALDEGLGLVNVAGHDYGVELDLEGLLRMDAPTQYKTYGEGIGAGLLSPNEGRRKLDLPPVKGGDSPYLQQQNYSLEALAKRDAQPDPFSPGGGNGSATPPPGPADDPADSGTVGEPDADSSVKAIEKMSRNSAFAAWALRSQLGLLSKNA